jgi:hypothetical protein
MQKARAALFGATLAAIPLGVALAASPATPVPGMTVYDKAGHPIGVLAPLPQATPFAPVFGWGDFGGVFANPSRVFAQQQKMLKHVSEEMNALLPGFDAPGFGMAGSGADPLRMIEAAFGQGAALPPGAAQVVVTSFSNGHGSCSQTVTYSYSGRGAAPKVAVQRIGDACGALPQAGLRSIPAAAPQAAPKPAPDLAPADIAPNGSRLVPAAYRVTERPQQFQG